MFFNSYSALAKRNLTGNALSSLKQKPICYRSHQYLLLQGEAGLAIHLPQQVLGDMLSTVELFQLVQDVELTDIVEVELGVVWAVAHEPVRQQVMSGTELAIEEVRSQLAKGDHHLKVSLRYVNILLCNQRRDLLLRVLFWLIDVFINGLKPASPGAPDSVALGA